MSSTPLALRQRQAELMDQPGLDEHAHRNALTALQRVNRFSRTGHIFWDAIEPIATRRQLKRIRLLDLACGGGDLAIWLARQGAKCADAFSVHGYDISPIAVAHAEAQARRAGVENVQFLARDALHDSLDAVAGESFDIIMCSLFLHHLAEQDVVTLLRKMTTAARHAVIIDDLRRTRFGYCLAWAGCRLLTRSPIVHVDGPMSVQSAFTVNEACTLAGDAGLHDIALTTHWPQRFLMTWQRN